jgi:hypothetical protein
VSEIAPLVLKVCEVDEAQFEAVDKAGKKDKKYLDLKKVYGKLSTKQSMLMKTFAANYNKLLKQTIEQANGKTADPESNFF